MYLENRPPMFILILGQLPVKYFVLYTKLHHHNKFQYLASEKECRFQITNINSSISIFKKLKRPQLLHKNEIST